MLLHMYVIFTSRYCFLSKCAQYDPSCRRALKHYSFIHSLISILGFYGTYLIYGHQDVLFGPYKDITFRVKSLMYKGIERLQKEEFIQAEIDELIQGFRNTSGRDFDPRSIVEKLMGELHAKIVSNFIFR